MIKEFSNLTEEERALMYKVPVLVTVLVAGADNKIDKREINKAISISKLKITTGRRVLSSYYEELEKTFEADLHSEIEGLPEDAIDRKEIITKELKKLNDIFPKLDNLFAVQFYASIKDFATKVAEASGGFFGALSIGYEEWKELGLDMINDPNKA